MNFMKKIVLIVILLSFYGVLFGQKKTINVENFTLSSEVLKEEQQIKVYLPENYESTSQQYPVLFVLDGERYFLNGITYQQNLTFQDKSPYFIVVGIINNDNSKRKKYFHNQSEDYIKFIERELVEYIDKNYRTLNERILFGWELGASLAIEIFNIHPSFFKSFILASPTHITTERINAASEMLKNKKELNNFFYITLGLSETWALEQTNLWVNALEQNAPQKLSWEYEILEDEDHYSTPLIAINKGLSIIFKDYETKRFYSLQEFIEFGGIEALNQYYKKRGQRYGIDTNIHDDTKHYLFLQSMIEDDFNWFEFFAKKFKLKEFMVDYYTNPLWFIRIANFYLKHDCINIANEIYDVGLDKFNESAKLYYEKGKLFELKENVSKAQSYYKKAIDIARKDSLPELKEYQKKIEIIEP